MTITIIAFFFLVIFGCHIVFALGFSAAITLFLNDVPVAILAQRIFAGLDSFTIMAIPFFVLVGVIMEKGGIAKRIVDFADALVGWVTGSLLMVSVLTGTGLAAISGSGSADTAATASVMLPEMRKRRYDIDFAAGLIAAGGTLAPVIPPSIMMVILATVSNLSVGKMFLAGILPGLLMAVGLLIAARLHAAKTPEIYSSTKDFSAGNLLKTIIPALPAFCLPVIVVGGIVGGVFTPTEAACVAVFVGLFISLFIYREIRIYDLPEIIRKSASISASVMMIIAAASIFSWLIASQNIPSMLAGYLKALSDSPAFFLILINIMFILIGMFMESISAILILVPVFMPIALAYGIDPIHFGVIIIINLSIGMITPPYGITLFVASSIANRSILQVASKIWIPLTIMITTLFLVTYIPQVVLFLPNLVFK